MNPTDLSLEIHISKNGNMEHMDLVKPLLKICSYEKVNGDDIQACIDTVLVIVHVPVNSNICYAKGDGERFKVSLFDTKGDLSKVIFDSRLKLGLFQIWMQSSIKTPRKLAHISE